MKTIEFLKFHTEAGGFEFALERLSEELGIRVKAYPEQDTYVLNYDQINSPKTHPIVRECRSLVINSKLEVVSRSFDRFFNYGEGECEVDFSSAFAMEKADGSLIGLYFNPGTDKWEFRTRGTGFAESEMPMGRVFKEAILDCIGLTDEELQDAMNSNGGVARNLTTIFEFTSPENRIVTRYEKPELVVLAVRENSTGIYPVELNGENVEAAAYVVSKYMYFKNVRACRMLPVTTVAEVETAVAELTDLQEGFVVVDSNNNRCKIKSPAYVKCHHIRGEGLTPKRIAELVAINEQDEYLAVFPEDQQFFEPYLSAKETLLKMMNLNFNLLRNIEDQKEFASFAKAFVFSALLFQARKKNATIESCWAEARESYKVDLLEWQKTMMETNPA